MTMDWRELGGTLIKAGAPIIGTALGGPFGGMIGGTLGNILGNALGVEPTPEAVETAIRTTPPAVLTERLAAAEAEAQAKYSFLTAEVQAKADVANQSTAAVNETIRAEVQAKAASPDGWWGSWRMVLAWTLAVETCLWPPFMMYLVVKGGIGDLVQSSGLVTTWWAARFGLLGVSVWTGSNERQTAITGQPVGGIVSTIANVVKGKR
jgi:hypothetical protein